MFILPLLAIALSASQDQTVTLNRVSKEHEKLSYEVNSHLQDERREEGLDTWMPSNRDITYKFSAVVNTVKPGGFLEIHYLRPTMTDTVGETFNSPPVQDIQKVNLDLLLTVTPLNEITAEKDLAKPAGKGGLLAFSRGSGAQQLNPLIGQFVSEIYRLALNVGSVDSSLDFTPRLPIDDVKPGDTWKTTVGYSPQMLQSKDKTIVQRLDYTYTYVGIVEADGKKVYRVTADLNVDTDLAKFFHDSTGTTPEETGLKAMPMTLKSHIDFDLDMNTRETLHAEMASNGTFSIQLNDKDEALFEERFKGSTTLDLTSRT